VKYSVVEISMTNCSLAGQILRFGLAVTRWSRST